eukprot:215677_1
MALIAICLYVLHLTKSHGATIWRDDRGSVSGWNLTSTSDTARLTTSNDSNCPWVPCLKLDAGDPLETAQIQRTINNTRYYSSLSIRFYYYHYGWSTDDHRFCSFAYLCEVQNKTYFNLTADPSKTIRSMTQSMSICDGYDLTIFFECRSGLGQYYDYWGIAWLDDIVISGDKNQFEDKKKDDGGIKVWFEESVAIQNDKDNNYSHEYYAKFIENGFDNWSAIKSMTDQDLKEVGIHKLGHRKTIIIAIQQMS